MSDWWDLLLARASLRCHPLAQFFAYRGLRDNGYSPLRAWRVARGLRRPAR
jgi:hypothetical protein